MQLVNSKYRLQTLRDLKFTENLLVYKFIDQKYIKLFSNSKLLRKIIWKLFFLSKGINSDANLSKKILKRFGRYSFQCYFQDWKFADVIGSNYFNKLIEHINISEAAEELLTYQEKKSVILVHLRLGDYLEFPDIYTIIPEDYFMKSISLLNKDGKKPIWIFCEQLDSLEIYYPKLVRIADKIIVRNIYFDDLSSFYLLSKARYLVMANSTFSLWAGWIASNNGAKVISIFNQKDLDSIQNYHKWYRFHLEDGIFIKPTKNKVSKKILMQELNRKYASLFKALNSLS